MGQSNLSRRAFVGYNRIGKYEFRAVDWKKDLREKNMLIVVPVSEVSDKISIPTTQKKIIYSPTGRELYYILKT